MKFIPQVFIIIIPIFLFCSSQTTQIYKPDQTIHHSFNIRGENFYNSDRGVSYSIGQVFNLTDSGEENGVQEFVQFLLISDLLVEKIFKNASFSKPTVNFNLIESSSFLLGNILTISRGNSFSFENWNTNSIVTLVGQYSRLIQAPKAYTPDKVDAIKAEILGVVSFFTSRNLNSEDVSNILPCPSLATLTNTSGIPDMRVGEIFNLAVSTTNLKVCGGSGVIINAKSGSKKNIENDVVFARD